MTTRPAVALRWPAAALPAWAIVPFDVGGLSLLTALFGLVWDVAYHVDHGRDVTLLNPPHLVILVGLAGLGSSAALAVLLATLGRAPGGVRIGPLRVPYAALPLGTMAAGALAGFPLDDLWHRTYGIDVTLWSPTHLTMIGGAALATFALPLLVAEGARGGAGVGGSATPGRLRRTLVLGGLLLALSVFQLEYDFGVPQWQAAYQPLLIAIAAGVGLVAARASLGPGAALWAALWFLLARLLLTLVVGPGLGHTPPRFPLYLGSAAVVELAFLLLLGRRGSTAAALLAGVLVGTAGLATEWGWSHLWGVLPWSASLLPRLWAPALAAVLASLVGVALGRVLAGQRAGLPAWAVVGSVLGLALLLAVPLPRDAGAVTGRVTATPAGDVHLTTDRLGLPAAEQDVRVEVTLTPAGAAAGADWFEVLAWQGGGRRAVPLLEEAPGRYRTAEPVPTGGSWKAMVYLARGAELVALPVAFPADPEYGSGGIPLVPVREAPFVPSQRLLTTEAHDGPPGVASAAYAALVGLWALWLGLLLYAARMIARRAAGA
ncbi:MAG TPA: hypothetical protein VOB72_15830 [Candidatus Dormibacteraeota bacterium]|nr:hypothetical protein [Candidatus Dormibacteraeota bacterium]